MKKLLSLILAVALVLGCIGVISFVQATEEAGGVKLTYTNGATASEQLFFYNVAEGITVSGDTATLKVKVFNMNYTGRAWFDVKVVDALGADIPSTGSGAIEIAKDASNEFTLTFASSQVTDGLVVKLLITALENLPAGTEFIVTSNADMYPNASKQNGGIWSYPTTVNAEIITVSQVPGYVAPAPVEEKEIDVTFTSGSTDNHLYFYNVNEGITVSGGTATLKLAIANTNYAGRTWADVTVINGATNAVITATGTGFQEVFAGDASEFTITFPASEVTENLVIKIQITALENLPAGTIYNIKSNANIAPAESKTNGGLWTYGCEATAQEVVPAQPVTDTSLDISFVESSTDNHLYFYNVNEGITVAGDTATIKFAITNKTFTGRSWASVTAINGGANTELATTEFQEAVLGQKLEYTLTIPANEVHENLVIKVQITALATDLISAESVYNLTTNANILPNNEKQNNGLWTYGCAVTAVEADDEQPAPPTTTEPPVQQDPVAVKLNINVLPGENKTVHINNTTTITEAMITAGVVKYTTTIYNPNSHDITIQVQLLNGWNPLQTNPYVEVTVPAYTSKTVSLQASLTETTSGVKEEINVRYCLVSGYQVGDAIYFTAENAGAGFYDVANWWLQEAGNSTETVTELPVMQAPQPTQKPVATKIKYNANVDGTQSIFQVNTGKATIKARIFNIGSNDVQMYAQLLNGWDPLADNPNQFFSIAAGEFVEVNLTTALDNGAVPESNVAFRFGFQQAVPAGTEILVQILNADDSVYDYSTNWWAEHASAVEMVAVATVPENADRIPTGVQFTAKDDIDVLGTWFATNKGVVTSADIKDDVITKTYKIKNTSKSTISVKFDLQATVKGDDGNDTWMAPYANDYVEIAPGETAEVKYELDVDGGGIVEIYNQEVPISELFARFDFLDETGQSILEKGTSFIIYADADEIDLVRAIITYMPESWTIKAVYDSASAGTGDMLPVALIGAFAIGFVALVVVSKKRKEN